MKEKKEKKTKIEKKSIEEIKEERDNKTNELLTQILSDDGIDQKTKDFLSSFKNPDFIENILDLENKLVVNSVYLNKITKMGRSMSTMVWQFYRHRGKLNVNKLIKQYGRENLTINYKIFLTNKEQIEEQIDESTLINIEK